MLHITDGMKLTTDIFQSRIVSIFQPMKQNKPNPYIEPILHGKGQDFESLLEIIAEIFKLLSKTKMQVT
jgi:hypothetical protein